MKVLYAFQGTGNGHLARAKELVPILNRLVPTDVLVSGNRFNLVLPFHTQYRLKGLSFTFGKRGGINWWDTFRNMDYHAFRSDLQQVPVEKYDLIINDFEPVSAWAAHEKFIPCVSLSHQSAVIHPNAPKPEWGDLIGRYVLKNYAPAHFKYGFHFQSYDHSIYTPVIRSCIRKAVVDTRKHYVVYLPAFSDQRLIAFLNAFKQVSWIVFSNKTQTAYRRDHICVRPVSDAEFVDAMASGTGVLCGAGFETPAEAMYLGKKLMVVPMRGQYEQHCNAKALELMGIPVMRKLDIIAVQDWLDSVTPAPMAYPDHTREVLEYVLSRH